MSEHLDKAKGALEAAKEAEQGSRERLELMDIAAVQASMAQADALERIAVVLEAGRDGWIRTRGRAPIIRGESEAVTGL